MKVLITGARAPAALELARIFHDAQAEVHTADSIPSPLTKYSKASFKYHQLPSPRFAFEDFAAALRDLAAREKFDLVIPTCEEVFHLARITDVANLFTDTPEALRELHSKFDFARKSRDWAIQAPATERITDPESWLTPERNPQDYVFKPEFSRFATRTLVSPDRGTFRKFVRGEGWLAQRRVYGTEVCVYAVAVRGRMTAFASYRPEYRAGQGAGIYLRPERDPGLVSWVRDFARTTHFHGQVSFDLIRAADGSYSLLECNPRTTSGVHFFGRDLAEAFRGERSDVIFGDLSAPRMVGAAMWIYALPRPWVFPEVRRFMRDVRHGQDVIWRRGDTRPYWGQYVSFAGFVWQALRTGRSALEISSEDFEYNG